jgi:hypothetical protein
MLAQRLVERTTRRGLDEVLQIARSEHAPLTTSLPEAGAAASAHWSEATPR